VVGQVITGGILTRKPERSLAVSLVKVSRQLNEKVSKKHLNVKVSSILLLVLLFLVKFFMESKFFPMIDKIVFKLSYEF